MKPTPTAHDIAAHAQRTGTTNEEALRLLWAEWRREALYDLSGRIGHSPGAWQRREAHEHLQELVRILYISDYARSEA